MRRVVARRVVERHGVVERSRRVISVQNEVEQSEELAVDAARGSHTRWQEGHVSVLSVRVAIVANPCQSFQQCRCRVFCPDYQDCEADPDSGRCAQRR